MLLKQKMNTFLERSLFEELKKMIRISLASLDAEKKPFHRYWQQYELQVQGLDIRIFLSYCSDKET